MKCEIVVVLSILSLALGFQNLLDLADSSNASIFTELIQTAGLRDLFRQKGPFTVILPINAAFSKLPADEVTSIKHDQNSLGNVIQYHVVKGMVFSWDLVSGEILTSINGHYIRVYSQDGNLFFNDAKAVKIDLQASNGVIYLVNEVLNVPEGTIVDVINNPDYNISRFMEFLEAARFTDTLNMTGSTRYTLFVPSNAAIASLDPSYIQKLKSSLTYARRVVEYHLHPGTLHEKGLDHDGKISTLYRGHYITVQVDSDKHPTLNHAAKLQVTDIEAENGVVHIISHVLIPSTLNPGVIG